MNLIADVPGNEVSYFHVGQGAMDALQHQRACAKTHEHAAI
jgi:hypothetical protein